MTFSAGWAETTSPDPVKDCPAGLVCFTVAEARAIDLKLIDLQGRLAQADIKRPTGFASHFGIVVGCGGVIGPAINSGSVGVQATLGCGVMYGWKF